MGDGANVPIATIVLHSKQDIRITLSQWRSYNLAHLRVCTDATGRPERVPTKAGFGLQVAKLRELFDALRAALVEAWARGWQE